jgi:hypothetical protein
MQRITIAIPKKDNLGVDLSSQHGFVRRRLRQRFEGFTAFDTVGAWREYAEEAFVAYFVDTDDPDAWDYFREYLAPLAAQACRQEAIYLTRQEVEVALIAPHSDDRLTFSTGIGSGEIHRRS